MTDIEKMAREAAVEVERSYGMGGLSGGIYEDFAADVAKIVAQAVARRCAEICQARYMGDNNREDMEARRCAAAIRAEFEIREEP